MAKFKAAPGAPFSNREATVVGKRLRLIEKQDGGTIQPKSVVDDARNERSPLHKFFTWDDGEAAEQYRLWEARNLINHVRVVFDKDGEEVDTKGFHSVKIIQDDGPAERSYVSMQSVSDNPDLRAQVIAQALKQLEYWQARYGQYQELFEITKAIDRVRNRITPHQANGKAKHNGVSTNGKHP